MKAIVMNRCPGEAVDSTPALTIVPSSAMVLGGKPLFLPEFSTRWDMTLTVAFRLCRLGKHIDTKFAPRYIDSVTPVMLTRAKSLLEVKGLEALAAAADGSMAAGSWTPLSADGCYALKSENFRMDFTADSLNLPEVISTLSRYMTLQMGDMIVPAVPRVTLPVEPETTVSVSLNNMADLLTVKIK